MTHVNRLHHIICKVTLARKTYCMSQGSLDREVYRHWYVKLGSIVQDESEMIETRQKALDAMHRLQLSLF